MSDKPRRIVTGTAADGRSHFARVEEVDQVDYPYVLPPTPKDFQAAQETAAAHGSGGGGFYRIWGSDVLPVPLPSDGRTPYFESEPTADETPLALRRASILPPPLGFRIGLGVSVAPGPPGRMHWTDSTDVLFVMSGKHGQILDEGEVQMHPGDVLVQNGTNHSHQTIEPAVLGYVTLSALRTEPSPPLELLNPVSGKVGGHRPTERRDKEPMEPWQVPGATPRPYPEVDGLPETIDDLVAPRRVVTGTNEAGNSYFSRVETAEEVDYEGLGVDRGHRVWRIWQTDRLPDLLPTDGRTAPLASRPSADELPGAFRRASLLPDPLALVVTIVAIPPTEQAEPFRQRDTCDAIFVMGGEVTLLLDSGEEQVLRPYDVVIQNGTNHAWWNRGDRDAWLGVASFRGARLV